MAKKTATKKTTTKKASTKKTRPAAKKKTTNRKNVKKRASQAGGKIKLLKGEVCCLTGNYSYSPVKKELVSFLKAQGAKVVEKVTNKVTILIVGEGKITAKEKSAEALNKAGGSIRIIGPRGLNTTIVPEIRAMIVDPNSVEAAADLLNKSWLFRRQDVQFKGQEFSKVQFGKNVKTKSDLIALKNIDFVNCIFRHCIWIKISNGYLQNETKGCVFEKNVFDDACLRDLKNCTFNDATGKLLKLDSLANCKISDCKFDEASFDDFKYTDVENCTVKKLSLGGLFEPFRKCSFSKITASEVQFDETTFTECELKDVELSKAEAVTDPIRFEKCKLNNVYFQARRSQRNFL